MAYRNTLQADALQLVAKKLQGSLAVEGELPEDGLAAYGDDGDDLMLALARKIVAGEEEDGSVESVFAQAQQVAADADALLVDAGWAAPEPVAVDAGGLVVVGASAAVSSVLASVVPPAESGGLTGSGEWTDAAVTIGRAAYGLAPYVALAALLTVLTRSANAGMGISLGYFVVELIFVPLLRSFDWGESVSAALIGTNVGIWMDGSDALQAFLVLLAYTVASAGGALWIFQRRDITGATGS